MLCITLTAAALVAAGAAFAQEAPEGNRVEINGMQMYYEVSGRGRSDDSAASQLHEYPRHGRDRRAAGRDAPRLRAGAPGPRSHHGYRFSWQRQGDFLLHCSWETG